MECSGLHAPVLGMHIHCLQAGKGTGDVQGCGCINGASTRWTIKVHIDTLGRFQNTKANVYMRISQRTDDDVYGQQRRDVYRTHQSLRRMGQ
ncbi:uncharacterized protein LACBIDRAFT_303232 [Laccaria bicolor S238N-H82]|uniref:Predicted protein n=1 Tax=Laccaria bicolor (strain S238N-H82 / ATCC MYA-4686) TaxID=486041 RepID=B0DD47_LACBS|nr:uncharacterized protein LACBIDRAFT_298569 [Laccaria bicolor S238N-H82]XP_001883909.1 uncharacterized protein LACBIDRAFT_303232 [Laccaria bicolor S238N-H82]EDR05351.1 predicted protein [Laccaria bicolor S238N-H82]EDR07412.1 predicted protein [Laccaria bicolor S238N-H82]|eukprot:XP_001881804.1 predicted protein [Laccaria bicolor S238N-H82]